MSRVIWQYWEDVGDRPAFIDGLHAIARKNAGVEIVLVTPETLGQYLPEIPPEIFEIEPVAHKADMIRSMLVMRHGGMWLDSDAVVLQPLDWIFDLLSDHEFVGFNNLGRLEESRPWVKINCFASRPGGQIVSEWVRQQHAKFPRTRYSWLEIGTNILHPLCLAQRDLVKILPYERIAPILFQHVEEFNSRDRDVSQILRDCYVVMLSNFSLKTRAPTLRELTVEQIAAGDYLLSAIMRHALQVAA